MNLEKNSNSKSKNGYSVVILLTVVSVAYHDPNFDLAKGSHQVAKTQIIGLKCEYRIPRSGGIILKMMALFLF
jgi:hypothetical protein